MLDPRLLRTDLETVRANLARRGFSLDVAAFQDFEERRKALQVRVEQARNERNVRSKEIGKLKAAGADTTALMATVKELGDVLAAGEAELEVLQQQLGQLQLGLPNLLQAEVPDGARRDRQCRSCVSMATPRRAGFQAEAPRRSGRSPAA
jgi:seryl-tRNA synthetase